MWRTCCVLKRSAHAPLANWERILLWGSGAEICVATFLNRKFNQFSSLRYQLNWSEKYLSVRGMFNLLCWIAQQLRSKVPTRRSCLGSSYLVNWASSAWIQCDYSPTALDINSNKLYLTLICACAIPHRQSLTVQGKFQPSVWMIQHYEILDSWHLSNWAQPFPRRVFGILQGI